MELQLEESLELNRLPLEEAQSDGASANTVSEQPYSDNTTIDSGEAVDTNTRTYCSGVPTRRKKLLQGPSLPSLRGRQQIAQLLSDFGREFTSIGWEKQQQATRSVWIKGMPSVLGSKQVVELKGRPARPNTWYSSAQSHEM